MKTRSAVAKTYEQNANNKPQVTLCVRSILIHQDRAQIQAVCTLSNGNTSPDPALVFTNDLLAKRVMQDYPSIKNHTCVNDQGNTFGSTLAHTPLLHLFEHLIIDEQCRVYPDSSFVGYTNYLNKSCSEAEICVSYQDDLVLLRSIKFAQQYINSLVASG